MAAEHPAQTTAPLSSRDALEIEWQLAAGDLASVRRWLATPAAAAGLGVEPLAPQVLHDTYLDSADWRVLRAGFALRVRREGARAEATLKSLRSARTDRAERREITETLAAGAAGPEGADGPVGSWLRSTLGSAVLRPLFSAHTRRERFAVRQGTPAGQLGEIALDETALLDATQRPLELLRRVEVELTEGSPEALLPLVEALRGACGLEPARENKFAAGLRAASLTPLVL
ncbi:MAG: CYTH domain-containing protein [Steroidobacteraceae bacterium]